jgi:tRNA(Arg) A34 adenosine deaminase TadA
MKAGERPIGAVIVHNGKIVGRGKAEHLEKHSRLAHAELNALLATASSLKTGHKCLTRDKMGERQPKTKVKVGIYRQRRAKWN